MAFGTLIILTPRFFFPVCGLENNPFFFGDFATTHGCHATLNAVSILGLISILTGLIPVIRPNKITLLIAVITSFVVSILTILFPLKITGICMMATMPCRFGTLPGLVTAGLLMLFLGVVGLIVYRKDNEKN